MKKNAKRGRFTIPPLDGKKGVRQMRPRIINVNFDVTQQVATALRSLRDTGLFGNGLDCASVAEELLRHALLEPAIAAYWRKP